jgi:hypothetical protein
VKQGRSLPPLAVPLAVLAAVLVGMATLVRYSGGIVDAARERRTIQERALSDARLQHMNAGSEKDLIQRYLPSYQALQAMGFLGAEQRLAWIDSLSAANRETGLDNLQYQIGQQEKYPLANDIGASDLPLRQSVAKLTIPLVHEGDLMRFFRNLAAKRTGIFSINGCLLRRSGAGEPSGTVSNVSAECEIAWLTVADLDPEKDK